MDAIMAIAARRNLIVIEDACQGVGGGYEGRKFGAIGHIGCFSFNYYKNMTSGEGGGSPSTTTAGQSACTAPSIPATSTGTAATRRRCLRRQRRRASELMGAMLNVQLDRLDGMIQAMRAEKRKSQGHRATRQHRPAPHAERTAPTMIARPR